MKSKSISPSRLDERTYKSNNVPRVNSGVNYWKSTQRRPNSSVQSDPLKVSRCHSSDHSAHSVRESEVSPECPKQPRSTVRLQQRSVFTDFAFALPDPRGFRFPTLCLRRPNTPRTRRTDTRPAAGYRARLASRTKRVDFSPNTKNSGISLNSE